MSVDRSNEYIRTVCLCVLTAIAVAAALYFLRPVMIPFVLAVLFTYLLAPLIDLQMRHLRMPHLLAVVITIAVGIGLLVAFGIGLYAAVSQVTAHAGEYQQQLTSFVDEIVERIPLEKLGLSTGGPDSPLALSSNAIGRFLRSTATGIMSVISNGILVVIFMVFMLLGRRPTDEGPQGLVGQVEVQMRRYVQTKLFLSAITGVLVGATLAILGVRFAAVFGLFAFLLNFIPNIGSIIATLLPVPVVLLAPDLSLTVKVLAIAIPGAIQFSVGNLLEPKIFGRSMDLHPVVVLIALIFFGMLWGIVGMFLATPITAIIKSVLDGIEFTRPAGELLAGRFRPPPAEA